MFMLALCHVSRHNLYLQCLRFWFTLIQHILIAQCMLQQRISLSSGRNMIRPKLPLDRKNTDWYCLICEMFVSRTMHMYLGVLLIRIWAG